MDIIAKGRKAAEKVKEMIDAFEKKGVKELPEKKRWKKETIPTKKQLTDALSTNIYHSNSPIEKIQRHWDAMTSLFDIYINETPYSSSPFGFRKAYENIVGGEIDHHEAIELQKDGVNLLPIDPEARISPPNPNVHPVFRSSQQGIILHNYTDPSGRGRTSVVRAGLAVGGYDDAISPEYILYDTSTKRSSYLRARHLEHLSEQIFDKEDQGLIIQIAGNVKIRGGLGDREYKSFYVMSLCEIIPQSRWDEHLLRTELEVYKDKLFLPYLLKPLDAKYADSQLRVFKLLDTTVGKEKFEVRAPLPQSIAKKYSYRSKKQYPKRKEIYNYIKSQNPNCSHAKKTGGKWSPCPVKLKPDNTTHIGHIFSQYWCTAYSVFQESMNHPDNLYLSCQSCNSGLNSGCPDKDTLKMINREWLTIGDLIRKGFLK